MALGEQGYKVDGLYLNLPLEAILNRAVVSYQKGERQGEFNMEAYHNVERMRQMLEEPSLSEGFNSLELLVPEENKEIYPEMEGIKFR